MAYISVLIHNQANNNLICYDLGLFIFLMCVNFLSSILYECVCINGVPQLAHGLELPPD